MLFPVFARSVARRCSPLSIKREKWDDSMGKRNGRGLFLLYLVLKIGSKRSPILLTSFWVKFPLLWLRRFINNTALFIVFHAYEVSQAGSTLRWLNRRLSRNRPVPIRAASLPLRHFWWYCSCRFQILLAQRGIDCWLWWSPALFCGLLRRYLFPLHRFLPWPARP